MTKKQSMKDLNKKIKESFFYWRYEKEIEYGWGNAGKIMFIGQCPSNSNRTGKRGDSDFDKEFLRILELDGMTKKDFYFTNLIKIPIDFADVERNDFVNSVNFLIDEVKIVEPDLIITLGKPAREWFAKAKINFYSLTHPSAIRYGSITEEGWRKELKKILTTHKLLKKGKT